ncbi:MAG: glycosyltransferase family 4 protein [Paludibacter sp.]|nr:glycosyltransferase family 4 protein [Paludibacter sp.]
MTFIIYQNILSFHQSAFIRNLAEKHDVTLIVQNEIEEKMLRQGWKKPDFGKTKIIINPDSDLLNKFMEQKDAIHFFAGIDAFPLSAKAFKIAIRNRLKIGVYSEPFNWLGWKGKLRFLKYWILKLRYNKHIDFILAIGNKGRWCFEKTGFSKSKIYDWAYFTEDIGSTSFNNKHTLNRFLFVGQIIKRKNILSLVEVCKKVDLINQLSIIGVGQLEEKLKKAIENTECAYLGKVLNADVYQKIAESSILILPSVFDGWGAVVNEALMCGTPVIASDNCGASVLLRDGRGKVFSIKENNLEQILSDFLRELPYSADKRKEIHNWALQNISGEAAVMYFENIMGYVYGNLSQKDVAPWLK